jgi:hypothetical protein
MDVKRDLIPLDIREITTEEAVKKVEDALSEPGVVEGE